MVYEAATRGGHARKFAYFLSIRFGPPLRANPLGELLVCRRIGSMEYNEHFLDRSEGQEIQLFTVGLQESLSIDVQLQKS